MVSISTRDGDVGIRRGTYIQEPVIGLSDAAVGVHDIAHVFQDGLLGDTIFENNRVTYVG